MISPQWQVNGNDMRRIDARLNDLNNWMFLWSSLSFFH